MQSHAEMPQHLYGGGVVLSDVLNMLMDIGLQI